MTDVWWLRDVLSISQASYWLRVVKVTDTDPHSVGYVPLKHLTCLSFYKIKHLRRHVCKFVFHSESWSQQAMLTSFCVWRELIRVPRGRLKRSESSCKTPARTTLLDKRETFDKLFFTTSVIFRTPPISIHLQSRLSWARGPLLCFWLENITTDSPSWISLLSAPVNTRRAGSSCSGTYCTAAASASAPDDDYFYQTGQGMTNRSCASVMMWRGGRGLLHVTAGRTGSLLKRWQRSHPQNTNVHSFLIKFITTVTGQNKHHSHSVYRFGWKNYIY